MIWNFGPLSNPAGRGLTESARRPHYGAVQLGLLAIAFAALAQAQVTAVFDFDTATPALTKGVNVPFDQTAAGVTANFSAASGGFSVQNTSSTFFTLSLFLDNYLYPNSSGSVLVIRFSQPVTNISLDFATAEQTPIENPTPIRLVAYTNSTQSPPVGSAIVAGTYFGMNTLPMGTLTYHSTTPFDLVVINIQPGGATGILVDNINVQTVSKAIPPAPRIQSITPSADGRVTVTWDATIGAVYSLQYDTNLFTANWLDAGSPMTATNTPTSVSDRPANTNACFYRVACLGWP
jgi:hypothetical protein